MCRGKKWLGIWLITLLLVVACKKESHDTGKLRIAVIPKGTTHEYWKAVHAGAEKAAKELDVEVIWKGPLKEDDLKSQIDLVQTFTAQGVGGIVLAPLNDKALVASVKGAQNAKIPVVIFDSALSGGSPVSFVATDNRAAGGLAGERMAKLLGDKGKVVVLRYQEGSASTHEREEGFLEAVKKHPGLEVVSDNQYGGATTETAFSASESLLLARNAESGGVDGVFCPNESTTFGMLLALQKAKLTGKIHFIGFDASDKLVAGVKSGSIDGLVLQDPFKMGYTAVKTLVEHKKGQKVAERIDTGATLVDKANMDKPEIVRLLKPDLEKWLGK
ncbi:MAG: substrate-binding domain-containing protein [Myxococcales bacterium]|nr:substrate-binding domain-containing protein [Myxococcales bacterium]MCB9577937.1 substrate-binding domain-containing protein [Polyangiaceae bacterium]